jgi:hypothetical protein
VRHAFARISGLYFFFLYDLRSIYVYREWEHIDKSLIKKIALPLFGGYGYFVLMYENLYFEESVGSVIILFVLNSLSQKRNHCYLKDETLLVF